VIFLIIKRHSQKKFDVLREKKKTIIGFAILFGFLVPYVGIFLYAMEEYNQAAYNLSPPDPDTFIKANNTRLYAMAKWFEKNIRQYHMPHNMIVNTIFNDSGAPEAYGGDGVPISYTVTYDSPEWTGHYLMAEAYRYAVNKREGKTNQMEKAKENILFTLKGVDKILHVSGNGGMARYAWPIDEYPGDPNNLQDENHYLGEWNGSKYVFEDDTSRDMHNGIIMGLGCVYKMVDDEEIRDKVKSLVEDLLDYFLDNGWLYHKPNDDPNGTDLDAGFWLFGTSGIWTLAYLKVGTLVNEDKYGPIYKHYAYDLNYVHRSSFPWSSRTNVVQSYYGLLLDWEVLYILNILEENDNLRNIYMDYIGQIYEYTKYDRNAQFNAMWLILNGINAENADDDEKIIIGDVIDCLMRYYNAVQRFPGRAVKLRNDDVQDPVATKWYNFFTKGIGAYLYPFWHTIYHFEPKKAKIALTPDLRPQTDYLWSRPPYWYEQDADGTMEGPGVDYIAVYWPCRYYGIIGAPENYSINLNPIYPGD